MRLSGLWQVYMDLIGKNVLILGKGASGLAAGKYIEENGGKAYVYDDFDYTPSELKQIGFSEVIRQLPRFDFGIISPGISNDNRLIKKLRQNNFLIMSELDLAYLESSAKIIAVTGTNGKTTTVSIAASLLKNAGINAEAVGNIGVPFIKRAKSLNTKSVAVVEVSSFQLEQSDCFCADIATITNISPDHLERHQTFSIYTAIKKKIFNKVKEYAVMNSNNMYSAKCKKFIYSLDDESADLYIRNGTIIYNSGSKLNKIINIDDLKIKGEHNVLNTLAALSLAICCIGGMDTSFSETLKNFTLPKYRIECLGSIKGFNVYNDSKGTNPGATVSAIKTMCGDTVLIIGGYDKLDDYTLFFKNLDSKIKKIIVCGANSVSIVKGAENAGKADVIELVDNLNSAVYEAFKCSECKNILFSPATSSFDEYFDYKQRGKAFEDIISKYKEPQ